MKNLLKYLGIIALAAVIGFTITGCGGSSSSDDTDTTTPTTPVTPPTQTGTRWSDWRTTTEADVDHDGIEMREDLDDPRHVEYRFNGVYATGSAGLVYEAINNNTAYRVRKSTTIDSNTTKLFIPAYRRQTDVANNAYLPVKEIGSDLDNESQGAFKELDKLVSISIPSLVEKIGKYAFKGLNFLSYAEVRIYGDYQLKLIDTSAFEGCKVFQGFLYNVELDSNGNIIKSESTEYNLPKGITEIGANAFEGCIKIKTIQIPETVTKVGDSAFSGWGMDDPSDYDAANPSSYSNNGQKIVLYKVGNETQINAAWNTVAGSDWKRGVLLTTPELVIVYRYSY